MQLHADLTGVPVEVVTQVEPGAFGAAMLAGVACGAYPSVSAAVERLVGVARRFEPDLDRGRLYGEVRDRLAASRLSRRARGSHAMSAAGTTSARPPFPAVSTPALIVDLDVFDHNVHEMAALLRRSGKTVRPHVKTHRTPELARRQLGESAVGVTCATVGEAEVMVAAGIDDVLVANEVVSPAKLDRAVALARRAKVTLATDDPAPVKALSERAARAACHGRRAGRRRICCTAAA